MDVRDIVKQHYGRADLTTAILRVLSDAGVDVATLTSADLAPVDQLHAGFLPATRHLLTQLGVQPTSRIVDVGCGIGGPTRVAAADYGCQVTGVDLTPEFVKTATELTDRVGLSELASFHNTSGEVLPFPDGSFDRAMMIHVGMNLPDKEAVFTEVRRVLEPGGRFALFDQMRAGAGELPYPLPWAEDDRSSFVEPSETYAAQLTLAGFDVDLVQDRTEAGAHRPADGASPLSPRAIFGPSFVTRIQNNVTATAAGLLAPVLIVAHAV
jgi:SAM-dependent methyltransferase